MHGHHDTKQLRSRLSEMLGTGKRRTHEAHPNQSFCLAIAGTGTQLLSNRNLFKLLNSKTMEYCMQQLSSAFLVVEPSKIIVLIKNTIPKKRILSYSILGTIVSPNKILHSL